MKRLRYLLFFSLGVFYSCQEMEDMNLDISPIVVDAVLVPGETPFINISMLGDIKGAAQTPVNDAFVSVISDDIMYDFSLFDGGQGIYACNSDDFEIIPGKMYFLELSYHDNISFAQTKIPYPVEDVRLSIFSDNNDSLGNGLISYVEMNWNSLDNSFFYLTIECDSLNIEFDKTCNYFYSQDLPFVEEYLYVNTEGLISGNYYKLIIYSLTEEYAQYYFGSNDFGYSGNIENGYGIFTGINRNSIIFQYFPDSVLIIDK